MGKIFYLIGKSASGKDTLFKILRAEFPWLKTVTMYTTRPIREHEREGEEYHFVSRDERARLEAAGKVIECRTYQTVLGPWDYFTVDDGQFDLAQSHYLMEGTLESYEKTRDYFGEEALVPLYIYLDDGERLIRAVKREKQEAEPHYREVCRRFLADEADFCEENMARAGIRKRFLNEDLSACAQAVGEEICREAGR